MRRVEGIKYGMIENIIHMKHSSHNIYIMFIKIMIEVENFRKIKVFYKITDKMDF